MLSNYDEKALRTEIADGKRHYHKQKKTSLFGSETPRNVNNKTNYNRYTNPDNITNSVEENILTQNEIIRRERELEDRKYKSAIEKRATLQNIESYDPWGKPGAGAANTNYSNEQNGTRAKWEYEQDLKRMDDFKDAEEKPYPGFAPGFGCGNIKKNGPRRSDVSSNYDETQQNIYYPFGSPGGGAPVTNDNKNFQGALVTVHRNQTGDSDILQTFEEKKAYADHLEQELQRLRLKKMDDKYASLKTNFNDIRHEKFDNNTNSEYEEDSLYREAENRARIRELDRLKESYEQQDGKYENNIINNYSQEEYNRENDETFYSKSKEIPSVSLQVNESKKAGFSSTHNDYRQYSKEEYMNSRQPVVNSNHLKGTALSGSEEVSRNGRSRNGEGNYNSMFIDQDNHIKTRGTTNTYNNIFPSDQTYSASKPSSQYARMAPYATD